MENIRLGSFIVFNVFGIVILMLMQMIQGVLPLNPQKFPGVGGTWHSIPRFHS